MTADASGRGPVGLSAVIVTRGDCDLSRILATLRRFDEVLVWDNSSETDMAVYGRYEGVRRARNQRVYVQDDDCLISHDAQDALIAAYQPGTIVANMPAGRWPDYPDSCLVGWGSVFDRELPEIAFTRFSAHRFDVPTELWLAGQEEPFFARTCDVAFTTLTPHVKLDCGFTHLPWAEDPRRAMFLQPGHREERDRMLALARLVRDPVTV